MTERKNETKPTAGATKNAARIAELEAEIEQLKKDDAPVAEFPKWIPSLGRAVNSAEEEANAGNLQPAGLSSEEKLKAAEIEDAKHPAAPGVQKVQIVNPPEAPTPQKKR